MDGDGRTPVHQKKHDRRFRYPDDPLQDHRQESVQAYVANTALPGHHDPCPNDDMPKSSKNSAGAYHPHTPPTRRSKHSQDPEASTSLVEQGPSPGIHALSDMECLEWATRGTCRAGGKFPYSYLGPPSSSPSQSTHVASERGKGKDKDIDNAIWENTEREPRKRAGVEWRSEARKERMEE